MVNFNIFQQNFMPKYDRLKAHETIQNEHKSTEFYEFGIPRGYSPLTSASQCYCTQASLLPYLCLPLAVKVSLPRIIPPSQKINHFKLRKELILLSFYIL